MASPSAAGMKALFPEFASLDDADIEAWLVQATLRWTPARLGLQWEMVSYLFAAHYLSLSPPDGSGGSSSVSGPVTSESVGDVSKSYGSFAGSSSMSIPASLIAFTTTRYGVELIGIILSRSRYRPRVIRTGASATSTTGSTSSDS